MNRPSLKRFRILLIPLLIAVLAISYTAFTAGNSVPGTTAGEGSGAISGYAITNVAYSLNATTPTNIDQTSFTISPAAAGTVRIRLVNPGGAWYSCVNTAGSVTCNTTVGTQATVAPSNDLTVVALT